MQTITNVKENFRSVEALRGDLTISILRRLFDNDPKARSSIRMQINRLPADILPSYIAALKLNAEEILDKLKDMDSNGRFKNAFARAAWVLKRLDDCVTR